jgi:hypothetical protein
MSKDGLTEASTRIARTQQLSRWIVRCLPWFLFAAFALWAWGWRNPARTLPHYGDMMETVVGTMWWDQAVREGLNPLLYPLNYFPEGWRVASHSAGLAIPTMLWPLHLAGGPALAVNVASLLSCFVAYLGAYLVARYYVSAALATLPALGFAFFSLRWFELMNGVLQIFLGSALIPWMILAIERAYRTPERSWLWPALAAAFWSLATMIGQYFAVAGGAIVAVWILLWTGERPVAWRQRLRMLLATTSLFVLFSLPWLALNMTETSRVKPAFYGIQELNFNSASLNSLPLPFLFHPWLGSWARRVFQGPPFEPSVANFGLLASFLAVLGAAWVIKKPAWRPILGSVALGLILTIGMTVHWNAETVQAPWLEPVNRALWKVGHSLKPSLFVLSEPVTPLDHAIPLPGYLLTVVAPFVERGRMFSRYALVAVFSVYLLASLALSRVSNRWLRLPLAVLVVLALLPPRLPALQWPPQPHPGFQWLGEQVQPGEGIVNVVAVHPSTMSIHIGGDTLLAAQWHDVPTASGSAGVKPNHEAFLENWLATHPHPFWQPDLPQILRSYSVRYIAIQMLGEWEEQLWQEAQVAEWFQPVGCFAPSDSRIPWPWPLCVVEVPPAANPRFNVLLHEGWSGMEAWGVWAEGVASRAQWVSTASTAQKLELSVFPFCLPGQNQQIKVEVNGVQLLSHDWQDCEPWSTSVNIPAELVRVGANDLTVYSAYAASPSDVPNSGSEDTRQLSLGFSALHVGRPDEKF